MQHAVTNGDSPGRMPMCSRGPTPSATTCSSHRNPRPSALIPPAAHNVTVARTEMHLAYRASNDELIHPPLSGHEDDAITPADFASRRTNSVPASRPVRSPLMAPISKSVRGDGTAAMEKRPHFHEILPSPDRFLLRTRTEPTLEQQNIVIARAPSDRGSLLPSASSYIHDDDPEDAEIEAAIGVFEAVIEELREVSGEHEEAREQLAEVALEVAEALADDEQDASDCVAEYGDSDTDAESKPPDGSDTSSLQRYRSPGQGSVGQDVNGNCLHTNSIGSDDWDLSSDDDNKPLALEAPWTTQYGRAAQHGSGAIVKPQDGTSSSSVETVIHPHRRAPPVLHRRRASDSDACFASEPPNVPCPQPASVSTGIAYVGNGQSFLLRRTSADSGSMLCRSSRARTRHMRSSCRYDDDPRNQISTIDADVSSLYLPQPQTPDSSESVEVSLLDVEELSDRYPVSPMEPALAPTEITMDKVKTKLAAWSQARENSVPDEEETGRWIPLFSFEDNGPLCRSTDLIPSSEGPLCPPNSQRPSVSSSAKHSAPRSPAAGSEVQDENIDDEEEEEERPIELQAKADHARRDLGSVEELESDCLRIPAEETHSLPSSSGSARFMMPLHRQLSNLNEEHFVMHRDSMTLLRQKELEGAMAMNQHLLNTEDSMILTRSKFGARPTRSGPMSRRVKVRDPALSSIVDSSPTVSPGQFSTTGDPMLANVNRDSDANAQSTKEAEAREHVGCPICEVERPRWFAAHCKKETSCEGSNSQS